MIQVHKLKLGFANKHDYIFYQNLSHINISGKNIVPPKGVHTSQITAAVKPQASPFHEGLAQELKHRYNANNVRTT